MVFILKDKRFASKSALLSASIVDPYWLRTYHPTGDPQLFWSLEVEAEQGADDEMWEPQASSDNLRFPIRRWVDVAGLVAEWSEPYDEETGETLRGRLAQYLDPRDFVQGALLWEGHYDSGVKAARAVFTPLGVPAT